MWKSIGENIQNYKSYPRIVGETGGKDFILAHHSSNRRGLLTSMIRGAFEYQAQKCSAASRAYIPKSIWVDVKEKLLSDLGIDNLIVQPFSKEFSKLSAIEFIRDILVNKLRVSTLMIGYDHHFGKNREASVEDLIKYGETHNFKVNVIPAQDVSSIVVSSTKIRNAIKQSDFKKVSQFLGRPFELNGKVTKGDGVGRTIKFPTANIEIEETYKLIPSRGVYLVEVYFEGNQYSGMMNIGNRPTPVSYTHLTLPTKA